MKGYWFILRGETTDQAAQAEYGKLWAPIAAKYQARLNPTRVPPLLKEAGGAQRVIIVEFPSPESARACYEDPAYQEALPVALRSGSRQLVIIAGELN